MNLRSLLPFLVLVVAVLGCSRFAQLDQGTRAKNIEPSPTIDYTRPHWTEQNSVTYNLEFQVKNTSDRDLEFIKITASFYDKDHTFLKSEEIYISKWHRLSPGERSPGLVMTNPDRRIKTVELEFSCRGTKPFENVSINASEVDKL